MALRYFAVCYGLAFLLAGIAGFIPGLVTQPAEVAEPAMAGHGHLLGLFPVNPLHNIVHLAFGVWGAVAYRSVGNAQFYARGVAVIYAVFAVMGLIPALNTVFGLVPLYGHDIWLHAVLAAVAAYFGWGVRAETRVWSQSAAP